VLAVSAAVVVPAAVPAGAAVVNARKGGAAKPGK